MEKYSQQSEEDYLSSIDLGQCEEELKREYSLPQDSSLIIYKTDIKSEDSSTTYVEYNIYHPDTLEPLPYSTICSKNTISISVPVNLNNNTKILCENLINSGYNCFDTNDSFYNDICATYTTENGTDISLNDRKKVVEEKGGSLNLCQEGCSIEYFNYTSQKAKCNCNIKDEKKINNLNDIVFSKDLFLEGLKSSNYLVMKCYKLLLDFDLVKKNIGFIFMMAIFIAIVILFFIYIIKGRKKIDYYIQTVLTNKSIYIENRKKMKKQNAKNNTNNNNAVQKGIKKLKIKDNNKKEKKPIKNNNNKKNNNKIIIKKNYNPPQKNKKYIKKLKIRNLKIQNECFGSSTSLDPINKAKSISKKNPIKNLNINIIPINKLLYSKSKKLKKITQKILI